MNTNNRDTTCLENILSTFHQIRWKPSGMDLAFSIKNCFQKVEQENART